MSVALATEQSEDMNEPGHVLPPVMILGFSVLLYLSVLWPRLMVFSIGPANMTPFAALTLIMLMLAVVLAFGGNALQRYGSSIGQLGVALSLLAFLIVCKYLSAFAGEDPGSSIATVNNTVAYTMSLFIVGVVMFGDARNQHNFTRILLIAGTIAAALGVYETLRQNVLTVEFGWVFNFTAPQNAAGESLKANSYRGGLIRAKSTFMHAIVFGQFVAACLPLIFLIGKGQGGRTARLALLFGIFALAVIASNTRSPLVVAVVSLGSYWVLGLISSKSSRSAVFLVILGGAVALGAYFAFGDELTALLGGRTAEEVASSQTRALMFERAFFALDSNPLLGYGEGRSVYVAGVFTASGALTIDSLYLSYLIDNGYLGMAAFTMFFGYVFWLGVRALRRIEDDALVARVRAVLAFMFAILFGQSILSIPDNMVFLFLGAAYVVSVSMSETRRQQQGDEPVGLPIRGSA